MSRQYECCRSFLVFLSGRGGAVIGQKSKDGSVSSCGCDTQEEDWELVEDFDRDPVPVNQLELVSFSSHVTMLERAKGKSVNVGRRQAEYLLEHQEEIPEEWRQYYLAFLGTRRRRFGRLLIPYLMRDFDDERWLLRFDELGLGIVPYGRLVRLRQ